MEIIVKSVVEINTKIRWDRDLEDPFSLKFKTAQKRILDPFNDGINTVAASNGLEFTRADVSFSVKQTVRAEKSSNFADVKFELEFRRAWPALVGLTSLNELINRSLMEIIDNTIREGASELIDIWAPAKVKSVVSIVKGKQSLYKIDPVQASNIESDERSRTDEGQYDDIPTMSIF